MPMESRGRKKTTENRVFGSAMVAFKTIPVSDSRNTR